MEFRIIMFVRKVSWNLLYRQYIHMDLTFEIRKDTVNVA